MRTFGLIAVTVIVCIAVACGGAYAYIESGSYDVSAATPHGPMVGWVVHQTFQRSVAQRASKVQVPTGLETAARVQDGARLFDRNCALCHGAPDKPLSAIGKGINPQAPDLLKASRKNEPGTVFWVVDHGIKMTAMPDFGKSLSDRQVWDLAAFLHKDKGISAADYTALVGQLAPQP